MGLVGLRDIRIHRIRQLPGVPWLRVSGYVARGGDRDSSRRLCGGTLAVPRIGRGWAPHRPGMANGVAQGGRDGPARPPDSAGMRRGTGAGRRHHRGRGYDHRLCAARPSVHGYDPGTNRGHLTDADSGYCARPRRLWRRTPFVRAADPDHHSPRAADPQFSRGDGVDGNLRIRRGVGSAWSDRLSRLHAPGAGLRRAPALPGGVRTLRARLRPGGPRYRARLSCVKCSRVCVAG